MDNSVEQFSRKDVRRRSMRNARNLLKTSYIFSNDPKKHDIILQSLDTVHRSLLGVRSINNNEEFDSDGMESLSESSSSALAKTPQRTSTVIDSESEPDLAFSSTENNTPSSVSIESNTPTSMVSNLTNDSVKKTKRKLRFNLDNVDASKLETLSPVARSVVTVEDVPPTIEGTIVKQIVTCKINILKKNNPVQRLNNSETGKTTLVTVRSYTPKKYKIPNIENKTEEQNAVKSSLETPNNSLRQRPTKLDFGVDETDSLIIKNIQQHNLAESPPKPPRSGKLIWCSKENKLIENPDFDTPNKNNLSNLKQNNFNELNNRPDLKLNLKKSPDEIPCRTNLKVVNPNSNFEKCAKRLSQISYLCSPTPYPKFSRLSYDSPNRNKHSSDYKDCPLNSSCSDSCEKNSCSSSSQNNDFNSHLSLPIIKSSDIISTAKYSYPDHNRTEQSDSAPGANKNESKCDDNTIIKSGFLYGTKILVTPTKNNKDNLIKNNHSSENKNNNCDCSDEENFKFKSSTMKSRPRKNKSTKHHSESISSNAMSISTQNIDLDNITKSSLSSYNEDGFLINALGDNYDKEIIIPNKSNNSKTELEDQFDCSFEPENETLCPEDITVIPSTNVIKRRHSLGDSSIDTINASQLISLNDSNSSNKPKSFGRMFHTAYRSFRKKTKELKEKPKIKAKITVPIRKMDAHIIYDDDIRKDELFKKALEEKAKQKQLVRARIYCHTKEEFQDSIEQLEVERLLLISKQQEKAYLKELEMRDYEQYQSEMDKPVYGKITISDIMVPVTQDVDPLDNISQYYIVVVSHKTQVFATEQLAAADRVVKFIKHKMVFENLASDFKIKVELYTIRVRKSIRNFSFESKYNIHKESNSNVSCPAPNGLICSPQSLIRRFTQQNGLHSPEETQFVSQGFLEVDVNNLHQKESFHLLRVPSFSLVNTNENDGEIRMKILSCITLSSNEYSGLLSTVEDCGNYAPWNVKWCKLSGFYLHYWNDPKHEAEKEPIGTIDFRNCVTLESSNSEQTICGRRNTILIQTARFPEPYDRNTLLMTCTPQLTYIKHFFHATSASDLKEWKIRLEEVFNILQQWNNTKINSSTQITEV